MASPKVVKVIPLATSIVILGTSFDNLDGIGQLIKLMLLLFALMFGSIKVKPAAWTLSLVLLGLAGMMIAEFDVSWWVWLAKTSALVDVAVLLLCVSLLSIVFKDDPWIKSFGEMLHGDGRLPIYGKTVFGAMMIAPILNMGTIPLMSEALYRGRESHQMPFGRAVASGISTAMLWAPTFAPVALVLGFFPMVHWAETLRFTLPITVLGFLIHGIVYAEGKSNEGAIVTTAAKSRSPILLSGWLVIFVLLFAGLLMFFNISSTQAISMASVCLVFIFVISKKATVRQSLQNTVTLSYQNWQRISGDAALLFSAGFFAAILGLKKVKSVLVGFPAIDWLEYASPFPWITIILPFINILPIHPVVIFSIFGPVLSGSVEGDDAYLHYAAWLVYWHISLIVSPVSIINLTVDNVFTRDKFNVRSDKSIWPLLGISVLACAFLMFISYVIKVDMDVHMYWDEILDYFDVNINAKTIWRSICRRVEWDF